MTGNILSAELLPDLFQFSYLHWGALRLTHTQEAMQPEQNTCKQNQEWWCRNATTFWVPPVPQPLVFTLQEAQLPFHGLSFPTKFTSHLLAVICSYLWGFWKWVLICVCTDWFSRAWPQWRCLRSARCRWALLLPCLSEITASNQRHRPWNLLLPLPALLQNHCSAVLLIFRCWCTLDPCVPFGFVSELIRVRIRVAHCLLNSTSWWFQWRLLHKNWWE